MTMTRPVRRPVGAGVGARAYTLIEMLIVVAILGIAASILIPSMQSMSVLRVQAAVRTIVADITEAQTDALAEQKGRAIVFHVAQNKYNIVEINGTTIDEGLDTIRTTTITGGDFGDSTIASVNFGGGSTLIFDEMGGPVTTPGGNTPAGNGVITITGSAQTFTVTVEAYTGRITVKRS